MNIRLDTAINFVSLIQTRRKKKREEKFKGGKGRKQRNSHPLTCSVSSNWLSGLTNSTGPAAHSSSWPPSVSSSCREQNTGMGHLTTTRRHTLPQDDLEMRKWSVHATQNDHTLLVIWKYHHSVLFHLVNVTAKDFHVNNFHTNPIVRKLFYPIFIHRCIIA